MCTHYRYETVKTFLRKWPWLSDESGQYDPNGCLHLFLAILGNLATNCIEGDLESIVECYAEDKEKILSRKQRKFLEKLLELDASLS